MKGYSITMSISTCRHKTECKDLMEVISKSVCGYGSLNFGFFGHPRASKIQGSEGCSVLVAVVCYVPYNACASNSTLITTNIVPITRCS